MKRSDICLAILAASLLTAPAWSYLEQDIEFASKDGHVLKGKIAYPDKPLKDRPAVVLVHGSGPADMDHWLPGDQPGLRSTTGQPVRLFVQLRDVFLQAGYAVLRYNKRGYGVFPESIVMGKEGPVWENPVSVTGTYPNLVDDSLQAVEFLRARPGQGAAPVFMAGISEGTAVIIDAAARDGNIAGLVLLSPVARNLRETLYYQNVTRFLDLAKARVDADRDGVLSGRELSKFTPEEFPPAAEPIDLDADREATVLELEAYLIDKFNGLADRLTSVDPFREYYRGKFALTPGYKESIPKLTGKVLLVQGEADVQCPRPEALVLAGYFKANPRVNFTFKSFPGLGHAFSVNLGKNKLINTIGPIEPPALDCIKAWASKAQP
ncbi:MAG: hypothetical protein A2X32_07410 [Elusimicrobia bacterium GWC2_64_44]|nr:MAG: hypothetical protein A2X32_07410 [Elusimicrobia bacterium GWC2_64_44]